LLLYQQFSKGLTVSGVVHHQERELDVGNKKRAGWVRQHLQEQAAANISEDWGREQLPKHAHRHVVAQLEKYLTENPAGRFNIFRASIHEERTPGIHKQRAGLLPSLRPVPGF